MYRRVRRGRGRWVAKVSFGLSTHRVPPMRSVFGSLGLNTQLYIFKERLQLAMPIYTGFKVYD